MQTEHGQREENAQKSFNLAKGKAEDALRSFQEEIKSRRQLIDRLVALSQ